VLVLLVVAGAGAVILIASQNGGDSNPTVTTPPPGAAATTPSGPPQPVHTTVTTLALGQGRTRASFDARYPGGSFNAWLTAPRTARFHFFIRAQGKTLDGFPTFDAGHCNVHADVMTCHAGPFAAIPTSYNPWRVWVAKTSKPRARIRVRLRFTGSSAGA
jgi:hypothetical protein